MLVVYGNVKKQPSQHWWEQAQNQNGFLFVGVCFFRKRNICLADLKDALLLASKMALIKPVDWEYSD